MYCYRLTFRGPLHVDGRGTGFYEESEAFIRSDTLSAALLSAYAQLEPDTAQARAANPPFLLSSAFPFFQDFYFLPRPVASTGLKLPESRLKEHKRLKKIQWLETSMWREAATAGERWDAPSMQLVQDSVGLPTNTKQTGSSPIRIWAEEERPRLAVDRATNGPLEAQLFHFSRVHFHPEGGLFFLARLDEAERPGFEATLSLLGDTGIGADRTSGNGWFQWQCAPPPPLPLQGSGGAIALSLVTPAASDCPEGWLVGAKYNLINRGGWISDSGLRRKRLRMFVEGSQFARPLSGQVVDVTPNQPLAPNRVYRDGRGFFVGAGGSA